jgi:hypothetical protein
MLPPEVIPDEVNCFFKNTLGRNGRGARPDTGSNGASCASFGTGEALLEDISSMNLSYDEEHENITSYHFSKSSCNENLYVGTDGPSHLSSGFPRAHNTALSTDLSTRSSNFVHHAPKQYSSFYQGNGHAGSRIGYLNQEVEQESLRSQVPLNNPSPLNSFAGVDALELVTEQKIIDVPVEKRLPPSPLSLPDLSGDLDSQFRCLRQVQYHLEYLFDGFLQSVQEASSADTFDKDPFHIPARSILLNMDSGTPRLHLPSSSISNGRNVSPVSCSQSTEYVLQHSQNQNPLDRICQQNVSLPSPKNVPSNGLSPSSSHAYSEVSSVSRCYSFEDGAEMHGSGTVMHFPRKVWDLCLPVSGLLSVLYSY